MKKLRIIKVLKEITNCDYQEDSLESIQLEDIGIDSLRLVEFIGALEEEFEIMFDESDLVPKNLRRIDGVIRLLDKYTK